MMQKIINTMFYGSLKAKIFLWSVFIMILATILMGVMAAVLGSSVFVTYRQAVTENLETLPKKEKVAVEKLEISLPYSCITQIKKFFLGLGAEIESETYEDRAIFLLNLPLDRKAGFAETLAALSNGAAKVKPAR